MIILLYVFSVIDISTYFSFKYSVNILCDSNLIYCFLIFNILFQVWNKSSTICWSYICLESILIFFRTWSEVFYILISGTFSIHVYISSWPASRVYLSFLSKFNFQETLENFSEEEGGCCTPHLLRRMGSMISSFFQTGGHLLSSGTSESTRNTVLALLQVMREKEMSHIEWCSIENYISNIPKVCINFDL